MFDDFTKFIVFLIIINIVGGILTITDRLTAKPINVQSYAASENAKVEVYEVKGDTITIILKRKR